MVVVIIVIDGDVILSGDGSHPGTPNLPTANFQTKNLEFWNLSQTNS